jgi:hypothetical protein
MANRTWIGGGNNKASNPKDWTPYGTPQSGDIVIIDHGTVNVSGSELAITCSSATKWRVSAGFNPDSRLTLRHG